MNMPAFSPRVLRQEVAELTALVRNDEIRSGLREALKRKGLSPSRILLAGYMEDEFHHEWGVIVTDELQIFDFERHTRSGRFRKWREVADADELVNDFPAVPLALEMARGMRND
jgi:hypothetical protein